ncbi:MAG: hypothetical protein R3F34_15120 [Planctomycetota bacterium]
MKGVEAFASALGATFQALDWAALGASYCEGDATDFFGVERIEALRDAGLHFASDVGERLPAGGRSTYVGAGVAELAPILLEHVALGRDVRVHTRDEVECALLDAALERAEQVCRFGLPRWTLAPIDEDRRHDHLWLVSVLTDPVAFPALHDTLYERGRPSRATVLRERGVAAELLDRAFAGLDVPGLVHTSGEELELVGEAAERRGLRLVVPDVGRLSPLVGDAVYACRCVGR